MSSNGPEVKPPRAKPRGILIWMAELSIAFCPPALKLRRALLAVHPHGKPWGIMAKEGEAFGILGVPVLEEGSVPEGWMSSV
jgi:hypothetical protein